MRRTVIASVVLFLIICAVYAWYFVAPGNDPSRPASTRMLDALFWLACIAAILCNAAILRARAAGYAAGDASVLKEADGMLKAFVLYLGGLCLAGALGTALGLSGSGLAISERQDSFTAFDVVYLVAFAAVFVRATWWVFFQEGAELMADHHRMFRLPRSKAVVMLLWAIAMLAIGYGVFDRIFSARHPVTSTGAVRRVSQTSRIFCLQLLPPMEEYLQQRTPGGSKCSPSRKPWVGIQFARTTLE